jgi:uncharacterized protein (DUF697 family)
VKSFPIAAGLSMLMPVPFWDLLLEKTVLHQMIKKVCAEHGLVVSEGTCFRLSGDLINGVIGQQLSGIALRLSLFSLYIVGGIVLSVLTAAGFLSCFEHVIRTHLQESRDLTSLTEDKVRMIFLEYLAKPRVYFNL